MSHVFPTFNPIRTMIMFKLFTISLVAVTLCFVMTDSAQAGGRNRCGMRQSCAAPNCSAPTSSAPMATPAPAAADHMDHAVATPPATAQGNSGTYRSFSYEPSVQSSGSIYVDSAPVYRGRTSSQAGRSSYQSGQSHVPRYLMQKADPRKYNSER